ncbi:zinc finger protein 121-like [Aphis craccivora]|uniref:Zinc finger protein 121-like n=1 Tax=Aphis craccivora TaxID=307492 RepID=A0A6G0Y9U8_APHCR|nr:zinc finger protein 121-like [Aphis craccivora]
MSRHVDSSRNGDDCGKIINQVFKEVTTPYQYTKTPWYQDKIDFHIWNIINNYFLEYSQMDQKNDYSDVMVISDDDDTVNSDFKDKGNLGGKEKNLIPKEEKESNIPKKKKTRNFTKTETDVFDDYVWTSIIELPVYQVPENSIMIETTTFHCHYCVKRFPKEDILKEHLKNHKLGNKKKNITCQSCGKCLRSRLELKRQVSRKACNCGVISIN